MVRNTSRLRTFLLISFLTCSALILVTSIVQWVFQGVAWILLMNLVIDALFWAAAASLWTRWRSGRLRIVGPSASG